MSSVLSDVVIIGAGLGGTALALALTQRPIASRVRVYEARGPSAPEIGSGVILTPNGLSVLDSLGVFERIRDRCWTADHRTYKNDKDETTSKVLVADVQEYGYKNHRLWRRLLLDEMKLMLKESGGVEVVYDAKFEHISSSEHDTNGAAAGVTNGHDGVTFLINGQPEHASLLIGADGINSTVRKYLYPAAAEIGPEFTGTVAVLAHVPSTAVQWPSPDFERQCTIQGAPGAFIMIPEDREGTNLMIGKQATQDKRSRAEWDAMNAAEDKADLLAFYREGYDEWHGTARSIIDAVCAHKDTLYLWPFLRMPKLERWFSASARVVIVGDGAHALPPSSGQGVNQALEDVYSLTLVLEKHADGDLGRALQGWQDARQARIDAVFEWATNSTNVQRMPEAERNKLIREGKVADPRVKEGDGMGWLYRLPSWSWVDSLDTGAT